MSLAHRLMMSALPAAAPKGQQEWTTPGTYDFVVPAGVTTLCGVAINGGNMGSSSSPYTGGGGAGLHWRNGIPVTPGEHLTIVVGAKAPAVSQANGGATSLKRGSTILLLAEPNTFHWQGGRGRFDIYGGGGGTGGIGSGADGAGGLGAGTAGYEGNGGAGGAYGAVPGGFPATDSGGGRGGNNISPGNGRVNQYAGEGVGLQGRTADKAYGSLGAVKCGGGSATPLAGGGGHQDGGLRLMWGDGRSYPDAAADV